MVAVDPGDENVASSEAEPEPEPEQLLSECNEADFVIAFVDDDDPFKFAVATAATATVEDAESVDAADFSRAFTTDLTADFTAAFVATHFFPVSATAAFELL